MFKKNKKTEETVEQVEEKEEELIDKNIPDLYTAFTFVRDKIVRWIYPICNLSTQEKYDLSRCVEYIGNHINQSERDVIIADHLQHDIEEGTLECYNKTYKENGYTIKISITKKDFE